MARSPEKNALVRETRKKQILNAVLTVYIRSGFHGTDMDAVAEEAQLAKGLIYYYYRTKKELFAELYTWMFNEAYSFSTTLLENAKGLNPIEQLMYYTYGMFGANKENPRMMQFSIRVPFDAYAIFGPEQWKDGAQKSDMHRKALAKIIEKGIAQGIIPETNPSSAANSFWSVFVANVFEYSKLMTGTQQPQKNEITVLRDVVRFCFQGLGIEYAIWNSCLEKIVDENKEGGPTYEGL
ncbi:MAG: TetR/AcrR family transcriptional regulator [Epulopiscium sp.]|nr:TetR/AcrR family transcriptional regulator [Candidatus Epulonipiscium sp.]